MNAKAMSKREILSYQVAGILYGMGLAGNAQAPGRTPEVRPIKGKKVRIIFFEIPGLLVGEVHIYSEKFFTVDYTTNEGKAPQKPKLETVPKLVAYLQLLKSTTLGGQ